MVFHEEHDNSIKNEQSTSIKVNGEVINTVESKILNILVFLITV